VAKKLSAPPGVISTMPLSPKSDSNRSPALLKASPLLYTWSVR
jgi:hypothetical protein